MQRKFRRRKVYYGASVLNDGTVLAASPMRRPARDIVKRDGIRFDEDGATVVLFTAGKELRNRKDEGRIRFFDIIATNLNTRRAIRELVLPPLAEMQEELAALRREVADLREELASGAGG